MLIFKKLILENFGPYKGKNIVKLIDENSENQAPIVLFGGMNGGGKTTLMDSIRLALYGKRFHNYNRPNLSYNDYLIQSINKKIELGEKTRIELTFEHVVNEQWIELKVVRYWNHSVKDGNDNLVIIEGELPDLNLTENWDEYIENFLPLGISNLFLFDGEQVKELAEQDEPTEDVKKAIKSLLGLELANQLANDLEILISRKQKDIKGEYHRDKLANLEAELQDLLDKKSILLTELQEAEFRLKTIKKNHQKASESLRNIGTKIAGEREKLRQEKLSLEKKIDDINNHLLHLASQVSPLGLISDLLTDMSKQLEKEGKLLQIKNAQGIWQEKDQKLLNFLHQLEINENQYQQIQGFIEQENNLLTEQLKTENIYLEAEETTLGKLNNILNNLLPFQQNQVQENVSKLIQLEKQLISIEESMLKVNAPQEYQDLERKYQEEERLLIEQKMKGETIKQTLNILERKIVEMNKILKSYGEDNIKEKQAQHIIELIPKIKNKLGTFQQKLTQGKLNKLESEVTNCFRYLLHKSNLIGKVSIADDNFALTLYDNHGLKLPKNRLSAGEKQLLAIALLWGLARVSEKNLPIAIDTPLGRLDSSHRHNLIERYFPTASHQVILLSTDTEIGEKEVNFLREKEAIALEYLLDYDSKNNETKIKTGYFW